MALHNFSYQTKHDTSTEIWNNVIRTIKAIAVNLSDNEEMEKVSEITLAAIEKKKIVDLDVK